MLKKGTKSKQRETNRVKTEASSLRQEAVNSSDETSLPNAQVEYVSADLSQDLHMNRRFELQTPSLLKEAELEALKLRESKMDEIEKNKELAHQRGEAGVKKAEEARRRAEELNLKAQQAREGRNAFWRLGGGMSRYGGTFSEEFSAKNYHSIFIHCLNGANVTGIIIMILRKIQNWTKLTTISEFCM
ncbi:hypothetical protein PsorP6_013333 [Peronosclerospora sorghi]|uniref:Uncharacterized protein n=1 Tax=Peronosclerospora sorghi TaxID=230839 RepID=A0ACC0WK13_9STRA|nr:hypothetical protein PsorP6_013333 [Peronosclerospora sorghi]